MKVQGELVSVGLSRPIDRCRDENFNGAFDGWSVMFHYPCPCGETHNSQALNVWKTGDCDTDTAKHECPTTHEHNEVELTRPNLN